ncbi:hypothetical protein ACCW76_20615 [Pantoea sp. C8B4]|uniref:hypothetical protein n=1 Tax=Pantoea sp. C8B4 TaxID=3243083 RepID=UPI003EDA15D1
MIFTDDKILGYGSSHQVFSAGDELVLDKNYRRAHLPLVNSSHPDVIASDEDYCMGTYNTHRHSIVLPVSDERLRQTSTFIEIEKALRTASFASKIAWDLLEKRKNLLHATISSGLNHDCIEFSIESLQTILDTQPVKKYRLGGIFMGPVNTGRLYLKVYPEATCSGHIFGEIQSQLGLRQTEFFLVGYFNLTDHLNQPETVELSEILSRFCNETFWEDELRELWIISTQDDLVLSGKISKKIIRST